MTRNKRAAIACTAGILLVLAALGLGLCLGGQPVPLRDVQDALLGNGSAHAAAIVWEIRLPRSLAAAVAGIGLGLAASLLHVLTRNPVADAGLLGSNAGATVAVALGMAIAATPAVTGGEAGATGAAASQLLIANPLAQLTWALLGALAATGFVCAVGLGGRVHSTARLVLLGVALGAVLLGVTNGIMLAVPQAFDGMRHWLAGSTVGVSIDAIGVAAGGVALALVTALLVAKRLELTLLGDDSARALGVALGTTRVITVASVALASAAATALVGPITFVGLLAAHAAAGLTRLLRVGEIARHLLAACAGAVLLVCADVVGRVAVWPGELPAGIVVAVVGAPVLLLVVRRARGLT